MGAKPPYPVESTSHGLQHSTNTPGERIPLHQTTVLNRDTGIQIQ